ncbi:multidrug MFS transporter [Clavibacter michiganensis]|nr:epoxide hydrolase family protein [Clavibacter michiganensis]PPF61890.1 multidrug MFS transporter [Clavibacter michiganensis]
MPPSPTPFSAQVTADELADLRARLRSTRWPDAPEDAGWSLGTDVDYLRELVEYWAEEFDWPAQEAALARIPRFRVELGGLGIHFAHVRGVGAPGSTSSAMPLILSHGWPDSFWRYSKVIPMLTDPGAHGADPADAFDVVVPDMPGFGYSPRPVGPPRNSIDVAGLWAQLMDALGYDRFGAAGGDIGSHVSRYLALDFPERVLAVHRTDAGIPVALPGLELTPNEQSFVDEATAWNLSEGAYAAMHRTKPQTEAVGLTDSPAGLAAWIVEKLRSWSDCQGDLESSYAKDEILTLVSMYWFTGTIGSSMRMYNANAAIPSAQLARRVEVPSGFALFPGDLLHPTREWLDRTANTVHVSEPPRGGHFAAFEEPELYAQELRDFFRPFRPAPLV